MDTILVYTGWYWPAPPAGAGPINHTLNPDALAACATGHLRSAEFLEASPANRNAYLAHNATGGLALESWSQCHVYDHAKPEVRQYWTDRCLAMTGTGCVRACMRACVLACVRACVRASCARACRAVPCRAVPGWASVFY
jgi:hypothetical protein